MISRRITARCDPEHIPKKFESNNFSDVEFAVCVSPTTPIHLCQQKGYRRDRRLLLSASSLWDNNSTEVSGMKSLLAAVVGFVGFTGLAAAQAPVAVVEDVQGKVTGAEFMDYVAPGKVIKLGPAGIVVLGYMKSCWRETITGVGTVIVGAEESMVHLSEVKAGKVRCNSSHSQLIDREVGESAATVVRSIDRTRLDVTAAYALRPFAGCRNHRPRKVGRRKARCEGRALRCRPRCRFPRAAEVLRLCQNRHVAEAGWHVCGKSGARSGLFS